MSHTIPIPIKYYQELQAIEKVHNCPVFAKQRELATKKLTDKIKSLEEELKTYKK